MIALPGPTLALPLLWAQGAAALAYGLAQGLIIVYCSHRWLILWRRRRGARSISNPASPVDPAWALPSVTVQLPVFNERSVVERLIDAVAALDYPADRLEIQVLDDSTDETRALAAAAVRRHLARGVHIVHRHRPRRDGYKAGALAEGLAHARGELIAVFDADFVPPPDFLRRMARHFADPAVGMAQARWGHLNRDQSLLTRAQAVMLDAHFLLEHEARMRGGLFFNFNGTAGVWRRACIESAGGWQHDTLTEDLDLSYRAQLAGWRFVFDAGVVAPAELPADIEALKSQQRRWAKGSIQTARKLLPGLLAAPLPARVKLEAWLHLTGNIAYPLLLALGMLLLPLLLATSAARPELVWAVQGAVLLLGVVPVMLFLAAGQRAAGRRGPRVLGDVLAALVLGVGLSVNNTRAVVEGLGSRVGGWERTPKAGSSRATGQAPVYRAASGPSGRSEALLAAYFGWLGTLAAFSGHYRAVPFLVLLAIGFGTVGLSSIRASAPGRRAA